MATRRRKDTITDDEPATVPAVVTSSEPLTEESRAIWARWTEDREIRERAARIEATARTPLERAISPLEIADAIATDAAKQIPDWRLLRPEVVGAFTKIVRQQPEYRLKEIQQRDSILRLIQDNLPRHIQPLVQDFQTVNELITLARESAAFLIGYTTGRKAAALQPDDRGRLRIPHPHVTRRKAPSGSPDTALRLHLATEDEASADPCLHTAGYSTTGEAGIRHQDPRAGLRGMRCLQCGSWWRGARTLSAMQTRQADARNELPPP